MSLKSLILSLFLLGSSLSFPQTFELNSGVLKSIPPEASYSSNGKFYKVNDNFIDLRFLKLREGKIRSYYSLGLINRSDNFDLHAWTHASSLYPTTIVEYKNRLTTIYGGLRWQLPLFKSRFWIANQINFGINWYRNENKQYLHPHDNDYMQTGTGPYYLEVTHNSHLKLNARYELLVGFKISSKVSFNLNYSIQLPAETMYKFTTNTSIYGDYFEKFFQSKEYFDVRTFYAQYQIGAGIQFNLSKNEK